MPSRSIPSLNSSLRPLLLIRRTNNTTAITPTNIDTDIATNRATDIAIDIPTVIPIVILQGLLLHILLLLLLLLLCPPFKLQLFMYFL